MQKMLLDFLYDFHFFQIKEEDMDPVRVFLSVDVSNAGSSSLSTVTRETTATTNIRP
jgi:hypothetical protein